MPPSAGAVPCAAESVIQVERVTEGGDILRLRLDCSSLVSGPTIFTAACWVDGLLIDTGCSYTADQRSSAMDKAGVEPVVNTHSHEDHTGANADVLEMFRCPVVAHLRSGIARGLRTTLFTCCNQAFELRQASTHSS